MEKVMNKLLTIGLAAAALAGGVAATSGAAQAADWNHGRYERDHWRGDRDDWRWRGYRYGDGCRTVRAWSPYYGRYVLTTRCY
jgi:hypothetical protein